MLLCGIVEGRFFLFSIPAGAQFLFRRRVLLRGIFTTEKRGKGVINWGVRILYTIGVRGSEDTTGNSTFFASKCCYTGRRFSGMIQQPPSRTLSPK